MVAYKAAQTPAFIRSPDPKYSALLVYGPDASFVSERARELAQAIARRQEPHAEILRLDDRDLAENPDILAVELQTRSMFVERRIIHVKAERRLSPETLKELVGGELQAALIVEAGNLRPNAPLRKLFEGGERTVALPCYSDPGRDMAPLIEGELAAAGVTISRDARAYLMSRLGADLGLARSEVAKLAIYAGSGNEITAEDIDAATGDISAGLVDALAVAAGDGRAQAALRQFDMLIASGQTAHAALSALTRHFQRLHRICTAVEAGETAKAAVSGFRPPLHFKMQDTLLAQSRKWNGPAVARVLMQIQETVRTTRLRPALDGELTQRLLLTIRPG